MINEVRNTVLAILNKNNYGYISPADFNLFAEQAQLDIFEDYFYAYNYQVNKENARQSGTGYADLKKGYEEVIDLFSITDTLTQSAAKVLCGTGLNEAERVGHSKITLLSQSLLTAPSSLYPAYTTESSLMTIYPNTYSTAGDVTCQYIRYPYTPKWTYINITGGEPVFDQSQPDYQDFELPIDDQTDLTMKILQYAGLSIREEAIVGYSAQQEQVENANEK